MQFIDKSPTEPVGWQGYFIANNGSRSYRYIDQIPNSPVIDILLQEQNNLCAYCQASITKDTSSIEHLIPQSQSSKLSTNYHNLVAVCKDKNGKGYCEEVRGNTLLPPIIFYKDAGETKDKPHFCFSAYSNGKIEPAGKEFVKQQADAFLKILRLNDPTLQKNRADIFKKSIDEIAQHIPNNRKATFFRDMFSKISINPKHPYRQFILMALKHKLSR